nr:PREDICTED: uncharacterized protein LOC105672931 [Linepithema humile]
METWILLSILAGTIAIYHFFFKGLNFFKKHGILHIPPWPVVGNMGPAFLRQLSLAELVGKIYNLNQDAKYVGFFDGMNPVVVIRDPDIIKSIGVKNFEMFPDHRSFIDEVNDPLFGKNLFSLRGEKWRDVRTLLSPAFTSSKMKTMFQLMSDCGANFADFLVNLPSDKSIIEMKNCFTRYTNDVIATCAFGISVDSMRNPDNEFYVYGKEATSFDTVRTIKFYLVRSMPYITKMLGLKFVNDHIGRFFKNLVRSMIQTRDEQNIVRPDMLQLMMESRGKRGPGKELTIEDMTSQAFIFFFGGFDTVSTLMCFAVHEIAVNPNIQAKLRDEIDQVLKTTNGDLTYEAVNGTQYLDAIINETLRVWPVAVFLDRICAQDFELPPALPGDKPFVIKKGRSVWFPVYGLHRDSKYFERPNEFDPDRFLDENRKNMNMAAYIPFGLGPRMCIGNRFALLETKVMIFHLLARCELKPCAKTTHPMRLNKASLTMLAEGGFWLKIEKRSNSYIDTLVKNVKNGVANVFTKRLVVMETWILLFILAGTIAIYRYFFKDLNFFKKHGILHIPPWPVLGNMGPTFLRQLSLAELVEKIYNINQDAKYVGFFDIMNPVVMIRDPDIIKSIGVKNFEMFPDHRTFIDENSDPLIGKNLFSLRGEKWRDVRTLLSPAFTSSKMKVMFKLMSDCGANFADFLVSLPSDKSITEMKDCFTRYTNDVIATCAFGISVDSMRNPDNEFYVNGKEATYFNILRAIKIYCIRSMPFITKMLGIKFINDRIGGFFKNLIKSTIQTRDEQNIVRPDMLQLMMESRGKRGPGKDLTIEDITSQAFIFFLGGFDTVATLMCFAAHEIAVNPNVQAKLHDEVDQVLKATNGDLTYESVNGMQYLDAVINETLRLWPVQVFVDRLCVQDFELPPALPGDKPFVIKKGMNVWFPVYGLHRDLKYFERPNEFDPDRFLDENKKNINMAAYIPFGIGPRMCIGNRFALLETKVLIFHLLARCELKPCAKTTYPMRLSKTSFVMQAEGGFWLKIEKRSNAYIDTFANIVKDG